MNFTVTFSEPVDNANIVCNYVLTKTSGNFSKFPFITSITGSGSIYTVIINTGKGSGSVRLDVHGFDGDVYFWYLIKDLVGNLFSGNFTGGQAYNINRSTYINEQPLSCNYYLLPPP